MHAVTSRARGYVNDRTFRLHSAEQTVARPAVIVWSGILWAKEYVVSGLFKAQGFQTVVKVVMRSRRGGSPDEAKLEQTP